MATNISENEHIGRYGLYNSSFQSKKTARGILKLIDSLDMIYGFDLPQVVLLLSRYEISGHLNIISQQKNIYGISFSEGNVFKIDNDDPSTFLGQLCIQEGYLTAEEVDTYLKQKEFRFGEKLLKDNKLTADQLSLVLLNQIILRLTKLINSNLMKISFSKSDMEIADISISYNQMVDLSYDWVFTCFSEQWLQMHYMDLRYVEFEFKKDILVGEYLSVYLRMIEFVGFDFNSLFEDNNTIQKNQVNLDIKIVLRIVHQLILINALIFSEKKEERILESDIHKFSSAFIRANSEEKLYILTAFTKESPDDMHQIFETFSNKIHHLNIDPNLKKNILNAVDNFVKSSQSATQSKLASSTNDIEIRKILTLTRELIGQRLYYKGFTELKKLDSSLTQNSKAGLYALWCLIGYAIETETELNDSDIKKRIKTIKPDIKLDAEYFYVLGLYSLYKKENALSEEYFQESFLRNPNLVTLKRSHKSLLSKITSLFHFRKK